MDNFLNSLGFALGFALPLFKMGGIIYLYYLLCKFLKTHINRKSTPQIIVATDSAYLYCYDSGRLLVNSAYVQVFFIKESTVFVEMVSGDIYSVCKCKDEDEAMSFLKKILNETNNRAETSHMKNAD